MLCPFCKCSETKVLETRTSETSIRRRRECLECGNRFTTFETFELPTVVVKRDGTRQEFDRNKIISGLQRACRKRPVSSDQMHAIATEVDRELRGMTLSEIPTETIGDIVMSKLKNLDEVAYVRFASVYRDFTDTGDFIRLINESK
ncbi:MAG: transcriptional regulator NrdR [Oscillospiraceae bacterium]|jgi:transcriptional repressor NrdR|nr:transcriptional regulator NrdR [Oscillospiraceae bacterium]